MDRVRATAAALSALILAGCSGPQPDCTSSGDWRLFHGTWEDARWSCDVLEMQQQAALRAFTSGRVKDRRFSDAAKLTAGTHVYQQDAYEWDLLGMQVRGSTDVPFHAVFICAGDPGRTSLVHEMAHVIQGGIPTVLVGAPELEAWGPSHGGWVADGIFAAIDEADDEIQRRMKR